MTVKNRQNDCERVAPGRYNCGRQFEIGNKVFANDIECSNPAFGYAQLDEWEAIIVKRHESKTSKRAA